MNDPHKKGPHHLLKLKLWVCIGSAKTTVANEQRRQYEEASAKTMHTVPTVNFCPKSQFFQGNSILKKRFLSLKFWLVFSFNWNWLFGILDFLDKNLVLKQCVFGRKQPSLFRMQNYFFRHGFSCTILCFKSTYWNIPLWSFQRLKICGAVPKPPWPRKSFEKKCHSLFCEAAMQKLHSPFLVG